jgi:hypothetical protein
MGRLRSIYLVLAAPTLIAACATVPGDRTVQPEGSSQQELADEAQDYRAQSYVLWDMARRRQAEADVLSQKLGPNHEEVQRKFQLAQELQRAAEEADQKGRATRRQVPHNVVQ